MLLDDIDEYWGPAGHLDDIFPQVHPHTYVFDKNLESKDFSKNSEQRDLRALRRLDKTPIPDNYSYPETYVFKDRHKEPPKPSRFQRVKPKPAYYGGYTPPETYGMRRRNIRIEEPYVYKPSDEKQVESYVFNVRSRKIPKTSAPKKVISNSPPISPDLRKTSELIYECECFQYFTTGHCNGHTRPVTYYNMKRNETERHHTLRDEYENTNIKMTRLEPWTYYPNESDKNNTSYNNANIENQVLDANGLYSKYSNHYEIPSKSLMYSEKYTNTRRKSIDSRSFHIAREFFDGGLHENQVYDDSDDF